MKARWVLAVCLLAAALALAVPTISITPSTAAPGSIVTISITGQGAETCGIEIRDPANTIIFTKQITLSSNGAGSVQWGIPSDARAGDYTVYVSCTTSGTATATLTVTPLVGGEVKKDYTPFILTLAVATLAAASFVLLKRELKG
jgi:hypothetical protein